MKPKTILQKQIVALSQTLPPITEKQKTYSEKHSFLNWAVISRKKMNCLECGTIGVPTSLEEGKIKCPNCGKKLKLIGENKVMFEEKEYYSVITTKGNYQVVRIIFSVKQMKKNETPKYWHSEVMQHWIDEKGKITTMAKAVRPMTHYFDAWLCHTDLEIRNIDERNSKFFLNPYAIYPNKKILPILKRNGFKGDFHKLAPHLLFKAILANPQAEALLKSNQISILKELLRVNTNEIADLMPQIKIATRHNYFITDYTLWRDYINLLSFFGKDTHNPKFICPVDLKKEHNKYMEKRRKINKAKYMISQIPNYQKAYLKSKRNFFGLEFSQENITVKVLESVEQFKQEGEVLKHCLFTNEYFKKSDSLILSAQIDNQPIETIEVSISSGEILQARGYDNEPTKYHNKIINLVKKNVNKINQRMTA
jgi:uncharacterized Zn finger protein (UPF0148 family)